MKPRTSITKIYNEDQRDRKDPAVRNSPALLTARDRARRKALAELLRTKKTLAPKDLYMAALLFHHGTSIKDSQTAVRLARTSAELGYRKARSLWGTCIDRLLIKQKKKQRFGTQYRRHGRGPWKLLPVDLATTDAERAAFDLPSLAEAKKKADLMNAQKP